MNRAALLLALVTPALVSCTEPALPTCTPETGQPAVDVATVCGHLQDLGCRHDDDPLLTAVEECSAHYTSYQTKLVSNDFARLTQCYQAADSCAEIARCSLACPAADGDAGP